MRVRSAFSSSSRSASVGASRSGPWPKWTSTRNKLCPRPSTANSAGRPASLRFGSVAGSSRWPRITRSTPAARAAGSNDCAATQALSPRGWSSSTTSRAPCSRNPCARAAIAAAGSASKPAPKNPTPFTSTVARAPGTGATPASSSGTAPALSTANEAPSARSRWPSACAAAPRSSSPLARVCALSRFCVSACGEGRPADSNSWSPASTKIRSGSDLRRLRTQATARGRPPR